MGEAMADLRSRFRACLRSSLPKTLCSVIHTESEEDDIYNDQYITHKKTETKVLQGSSCSQPWLCKLEIVPDTGDQDIVPSGKRPLLLLTLQNSAKDQKQAVNKLVSFMELNITQDWKITQVWQEEAFLH